MSVHVMLNLVNRVKQSLAAYALLASPAFSGTPTAPTAAAGTSSTQIATTAFAAAAGAARPNILINGAFQINQDAPATSADDTYAHDQWIALTQTGTIAVSTLSDVENGTPKMARLTQSQATAQRMGYAQILDAETSKALRGQTVTLKFGRLRLSATDNVRMAILEWTGTADTVTSDVVNSWTSTTYTAGNFFPASSVTVANVTQQALTANTLADGTAITVTVGSSCNNLIVFIWTENAVAQNVTLDIGKAKLEVGSAATTFIWPDYASELMRCFYFYQLHLDRAVHGGFRCYGYNTVGNYVVWSGFYPTPMRIAPTGTIVGTWTVTNCNQPTFGITSQRGCEIAAMVTPATGMADAFAPTGCGIKLDARL